MKNFEYQLPTKIIFGSGRISDLPEVIKREFKGVKKILLVTGRHSLKKAGITDKILKLLGNYTVVLFDKVEPNPTSSSVNAGTYQYKENDCDIVIAIGGGSVIDAGKAIAVLVNNEGPLEKYQKGEKPENDPANLIAIPTTSGTSSEITAWSVITNLEGAYKNAKKSFGSPFMYPEIALIDPKLTISLSAEQTASTGLDVLCHVVEGYWSKKKNPLSDLYAIETIKLVKKYLPIAVKEPENLEAREKMTFATLLAGLCFSNSRTSSPHKVSYPITTQYNLPHGAACALTLPYFMEYIGENKPERIEEIVKALDLKDYKKAVEFLKKFIKDLGMPNRLSDLDITKEEIPYIAKNSYVQVEEQEDPVPISYEKYLEILEKAL